MEAYAYALQGFLLSLIALNSAMKVETVLRHPKNPSCMPAAAVSKVWLFACTRYKSRCKELSDLLIVHDLEKFPSLMSKMFDILKVSVYE